MSKKETHSQTTPDILEWIADEIRDELDVYDKADGAKSFEKDGVLPRHLSDDDPVCTKIRLALIRSRAWDRQEVLKNMATEIRATTRNGAMLQLGLISLIADDGFENELSAHQVKRNHHQLERLLYSVVTFLEKDWEMKREDATNFLPRHLDPEADLRLPGAELVEATS